MSDSNSMLEGDIWYGKCEDIVKAWIYVSSIIKDGKY